MKKPLNDFKLELIKKYQYEENFAETIAIMADSIVEHYGEEYETLVTDAIMSCKYIISGTKDNKYENAYETLKRENMLDDTKGERLLDPESLKLTAGIYQSLPRLSHKDGKYNIDGIDRIIILSKNFDLDNQLFIGTMIHETCHLIKSFIKGYELEGNKLYERCGLCETEYDLSIENGKVAKTIVSEKGYGIDEGVNTHDEFSIMRESNNSSYESPGYGKLRATSEYLMYDLDLKSVIDKANLLGDKKELTELMDQTISKGYDGLVDALDGSLKLELTRYKSLLDRKKLKDAIANANKQYNNEVVPLVKELTASLSKDTEKYITM